MRVSAAGFLFRKNINTGNLKGDNYTCIIHKLAPGGKYKRNIITSPVINTSAIDTVSSRTAKEDINAALKIIRDKKSPSKFIGAAVKDGLKEVEINSLFSDKIYAVRIKDADGKNRFRIMGKERAGKLLAGKLYA